MTTSESRSGSPSGWVGIKWEHAASYHADQAVEVTVDNNFGDWEQPEKFTVEVAIGHLRTAARQAGPYVVVVGRSVGVASPEQPPTEAVTMRVDDLCEALAGSPFAREEEEEP